MQKDIQSQPLASTGGHMGSAAMLTCDTLTDNLEQVTSS